MQAVGTTLAGRYSLEEVIGRGGMSTVYRATDQTLGRTVAVKILLAVLADQDPTYATRFEREARAAAALASSSVATVYDTGVDGENHYIVMEYIAGASLDEVLSDGRPVEISQALRIADRVADALAAAHAAGILHRDIKPANVMVADDGTVKVLDFGIARWLDGTTITQAASIVGTAAYMAPERALGQPGDGRADIYSLGCLLYAMLTGHPPFSGEISAALLHQQINTAPRPPSELRDGVSPALDALVLAMLAKAPEERPASAAEVRARLTTLEGGEGPASTAETAPLTAASAPLTASTARAPLAGVRLRPPARRPRLAEHHRRAIVMAVITAAVTLIAVALLSGGSSSQDGTTRARVTTHRATQAVTNPATPTTPTQPPPLGHKPKPKPKGGPTGQGGPPPGHGGEPPGQAKKHKH